MVSASALDSLPQPAARLTWPRFALFAILLIICHAAYFFFGYRDRALHHSVFPSSDFLLIYLPLFIVFAAFLVLLRARRIHPVSMFVFALLLTFLSFCLSLLIPFNVYGT
jgi:hypothetical protein